MKKENKEFVFLCKYCSDPGQGVLTRLFFIAKEISLRGHDVAFIVSDSNHLSSHPEYKNTFNESRKEGVRYIVVKTKKFSKTGSIGRVLSWLDFEYKILKGNKELFNRPDFILASSPSIFTALSGIFLKLRYKSKLIFDVRDIWPMTIIEEGNVSRFHPLMLIMRVIEKLAYKYSDYITGSMPKLDLHVRETINKDKKFFCMPMGYDNDSLVVEDSKLKDCEEIQLKFKKEDKFIVGYAGSIGLTNNLDVFFNAIKELNSNKDIHFVVLGSGDLVDTYKSKTKECGNVTFYPRVKRHCVQAFLEKCDILYLSTHDSIIWKYGQSLNKLLDYMLSGKPVIASYAEDGYKSMINEADSGVFIQSNNSDALVNEILKMNSSSSQTLSEMGGRGRAWVINNREYKKIASDFMLFLDIH